MLIDNILLLRDRYPAIREYFHQNEDDLKLKQFEVIESKAGKETIRYQLNDERPLMIHSMYDPIREAERIIASHEGKISEKTHVFFYGVGMGYHVEKFLEKFPDQPYSLYEPIPEVFFEMTSKRDLNHIINKNLRNLYIDKHHEESFAYLNEFTTSNHNIHLIVLPSYKNIAEEKYATFHKNIKEAIRSRRTNLHTDASFQKLWVMNSLINFKTVLNTPNMLRDIDRGQFEGKPVIIVSAGPSLAEDMEHLRYIKENNLAYIFSVGSAINSLIAYDVLPDAVFTYDPGLLNHKVFEKMIAHNIAHIPMVFGSSVGYETIENYQGPKAHFITSQDRTSLYFLKEQLNVEHDLILDSPSIAVMTFQILNKIGAYPIIFAGQNLGYLYDRLYSEGIDYDHIKSTMEEEKLAKAPTTKDVYGNEIKTSIGFNSMRTSIENFAAQYQNKTFINTTKGGAEIKGVPFQPIEEVIKETLTYSIDKTNWWERSNKYKAQDIDAQLASLKRSMTEFTAVLASFDKLLKNISLYTNIKNQPKVLNELTKFDKLYNRLVENRYYNDFLSFYIRTHVKYLANELKRLNVEADVFVKGKEIVPLFNRFMEQCRQGSLELEKVMEDSVGALGSE
ncbi:motility associated factor glycosyltransferase family protein [Virgibacillus sp. W0181]|uniref:motility associated factor glycosyltransferase family protein n=1 Tax=Virgibacillus sp. W0181 TaxID=3391581 RepID=UPI003F450A3F